MDIVVVLGGHAVMEGHQDGGGLVCIARHVFSGHRRGHAGRVVVEVMMSTRCTR